MLLVNYLLCLLYSSILFSIHYIDQMIPVFFYKIMNNYLGLVATFQSCDLATPYHIQIFKFLLTKHYSVKFSGSLPQFASPAYLCAWQNKSSSLISVLSTHNLSPDELES